MWLLYMVVFLASVGFSFFLMPNIIRIAKNNNWYDQVDHRKIHNGKKPRLGGVGMFLSFLVVSIAALLITHQWNSSCLFIVLSFLLIHVLGLVDDFRNIPAFVKLTGQILAAFLIVLSGAYIQFFDIPFASGTTPIPIVGPLLTVFWIVGITNAVNLIDGMDGFAGGISLVITGIYFMFFIITGSIIGMVLSLSLFGSLLGFMFFNYPPAKLFMGDSGSLFLGFALAVLPMFCFFNQGQSITTGILLLPITVLIIPIIDTFSAIFRRLSNGQKIHSPDMMHIHHQLLKLDIDTKNILFIVCGYTLIVGIVSLLFIFATNDVRYIISIAIWGISFGLYGYLYYLKKKLHLELHSKSLKNRVLYK